VAYVGPQLTRIARDWGVRLDCVVANFMHDRRKLRERFPNSWILTVIHDDFEAVSNYNAESAEQTGHAVHQGIR